MSRTARQTHRKDSNHQQIVKAFKAMCFAVYDVSQLDEGCDLLVSKRGETVACEIKDGTKPASRQRLTPGETRFRDGWQGDWALVRFLEDIEEIDRRIAEKCRRLNR